MGFRKFCLAALAVVASSATLEDEYQAKVLNVTNVTKRLEAAVKMYHKAVQNAKDSVGPLEAEVKDLDDLAANETRIHALGRIILKAADESSPDRQDEQNVKYAEKMQHAHLDHLRDAAEHATDAIVTWAEHVEDNSKATDQDPEAVYEAFRDNKEVASELEHDIKRLSKRGRHSVKRIYKGVRKQFKEERKQQIRHNAAGFYDKVEGLQKEEEERQRREDAAAKAAAEKLALQKAAEEKAAEAKAAAAKAAAEEAAAQKVADEKKVAAARAAADEAAANKAAADKGAPTEAPAVTTAAAAAPAVTTAAASPWTLAEKAAAKVSQGPAIENEALIATPGQAGFVRGMVVLAVCAAVASIASGMRAYNAYQRRVTPESPEYSIMA